jgi:hypothetical protein
LEEYTASFFRVEVAYSSTLKMKATWSFVAVAAVVD